MVALADRQRLRDGLALKVLVDGMLGIVSDEIDQRQYLVPDSSLLPPFETEIFHLGMDSRDRISQMVLRTIASEELSEILRLGPALQWGKGKTSSEPGRHNLNASNRVHTDDMQMWTHGEQPQISTGATIFTMGSCFAREIESALMERGFSIASDLDGTLENGKREIGLTNRYNTASMLLELKRLVLDKEVLPDDALLSETRDNLFNDMHYNSINDGESIDLIVERRRNFKEKFSSIKKSDAIFFTLGLNEACFEKSSGLYRNISPTIREIRRGAALEVHCFSVQENLAMLNEIYHLIKSHCRAGVKLFITISPVPLTMTYQTQDVIVANSEGKAILRAAAGEFCAQHDDVTYFPSYEMALYGDPEAVFKGDKRHINRLFVRNIMNEFIRRHVALPGERD